MAGPLRRSWTPDPSILQVQAAAPCAPLACLKSLLASLLALLAHHVAVHALLQWKVLCACRTLRELPRS